MPTINYQGFTLMEVLISLVLLSFIVLGFDAMEVYSLRSTRSAYYFHIATHQFISMAERLRVLGPDRDRSEQVAIWNRQNKQLLPLGEGTVTGNYPSYVITLYWENISHVCHLMQGCMQKSIEL